MAIEKKNKDVTISSDASIFNHTAVTTGPDFSVCCEEVGTPLSRLRCSTYDYCEDPMTNPLQEQFNVESITLVIDLSTPV